MTRPIEDPVTIPGNSPVAETRTTHPAFGQIGASRVSGSTYLYGSEFKHHHFVSITIRRSELNRSHSNDWHHGREELISVDLSESQWATFVSTLNSGMGVPCTIDHIDREMMPGLPPPAVRNEQFAKEMDETQEKIIERLRSVEKMIAESTAGVKLKDKLAFELGIIRSHLSSNVDFTAKQFGEHMEKVTESAKHEIEAYIDHTIRRAGLESLSGKLNAPIALADTTPTLALSADDEYYGPKDDQP